MSTPHRIQAENERLRVCVFGVHHAQTVAVIQISKAELDSSLVGVTISHLCTIAARQLFESCCVCSDCSARLGSAGCLPNHQICCSPVFSVNTTYHSDGYGGRMCPSNCTNKCDVRAGGGIQRRRQTIRFLTTYMLTCFCTAQPQLPGMYYCCEEPEGCQTQP